MDGSVVRRVVGDVRRDLESGVSDDRSNNNDPIPLRMLVQRPMPAVLTGSSSGGEVRQRSGVTREIAARRPLIFGDRRTAEAGSDSACCGTALGSAKAAEAVRLLEPIVDRGDHVLLRGDTSREQRLQERVAVNAAAAAIVAAAARARRGRRSGCGALPAARAAAARAAAALAA